MSWNWREFALIVGICVNWQELKKDKNQVKKYDDIANFSKYGMAGPAIYRDTS